LKEISARPGLLDGVVINVTWAQLEPKPGQFQTEAIDSALASVRSYNKSYPKTPLKVLLRIWPGPVAPKWVKNLGGPPVTILHRDMPITVGRFWSAPYRSAWRDMQNHIGAKYDSDPLIASVSNSSGSSITDEPLLSPGDAMSIRNLKNAGFTDAQYLDTLMDSVNDYDAWKTTVVEQTYSPYRELDSGRPVLKEAVTLQLMHRWREKMGERGVVSNHALSGPPQDRLVFMYDEIKKLGQPAEYQTHAPNDLNWDETITYGVAHGAEMIELWQGTNFGGFEKQPAEALKRWSAELKANAAK
jgi:hypothetical protein